MGISPELVLYGHIEGFGNTDVPWNSQENHCELHWGLQGGFRKDRKNYPWSSSEMGRSCVDLFHLKGQLGGGPQPHQDLAVLCLLCDSGIPRSL